MYYPFFYWFQTLFFLNRYTFCRQKNFAEKKICGKKNLQTKNYAEKKFADKKILRKKNCAGKKILREKKLFEKTVKHTDIFLIFFPHPKIVMNSKGVWYKISNTKSEFWWFSRWRSKYKMIEKVQNHKIQFIFSFLVKIYSTWSWICEYLNFDAFSLHVQPLCVGARTFFNSFFLK